jgi:hypothetical protein
VCSEDSPAASGANGGGEAPPAAPGVSREYVHGKSLDRMRFSPAHLVRGVAEKWSSRDAEEPLRIQLPKYS